MIGRDEVMEVLKREDATVFQHIGDIEKVDVIVPLADAVSPVVHVIDEIDMQRVPLAVFPVTHAPLRLHTGNKVVITVGNDLTGKRAVGQFLDQLASLVINLAVRGQHEHGAILTRLDGIHRVVVLT